MVASIQAYGYNQRSGAGTMDVTVSGVNAGDLLIANVYLTVGGSPNVTPSGFTKIEDVTQAELWYKIADSGDTSGTFTWGQSNGLANLRCQMVRIVGHHPTTPIADSSLTFGTSPYVADSVTASDADTLLVAFFGSTSSATASVVPTGMTEYFSSTSGPENAVAYETVGSGASGTRTWTGGGSSVATPMLAVSPAPSATNYDGNSNLATTASISTSGQLGLSGSTTRSTSVGITTTGNVATSSESNRANSISIQTSGLTSASISRQTSVGITTTGGTSGPSPMNIGVGIVTSGFVPSGSQRATNVNITTSGTTTGSASISIAVGRITTGAGSGSPGRSTGVSITTVGGATQSVGRTVGVGITTDGVVGGVAISTDKRPLVMDNGQIREFRDTDTLVTGSGGSGASRTFSFFGG